MDGERGFRAAFKASTTSLLPVAPRLSPPSRCVGFRRRQDCLRDSTRAQSGQNATKQSGMSAISQCVATAGRSARRRYWHMCRHVRGMCVDCMYRRKICAGGHVCQHVSRQVSILTCPKRMSVHMSICMCKTHLYARVTTQAYEAARCIHGGGDRLLSKADTAGCCNGALCGYSTSCGAGTMPYHATGHRSHAIDHSMP